jgi:hypothetical protein
MPNTSNRKTVRTTEISNDPRHPIRLEKKNTGLFLSVASAGTGLVGDALGR